MKIKIFLTLFFSFFIFSLAKATTFSDYEIGQKIENAISAYFERENISDPTTNFEWEYILIDNKKVKNAWCMPGGKIAVYTGILNVTKNINGLAAVMGHEIAHAVAKHSVERMSAAMAVNVTTQIADIFLSLIHI